MEQEKLTAREFTREFNERYSAVITTRYVRSLITKDILPASKPSDYGGETAPYLIDPAFIDSPPDKATMLVQAIERKAVNVLVASVARYQIACLEAQGLMPERRSEMFKALNELQEVYNNG